MLIWQRSVRLQLPCPRTVFTNVEKQLQTCGSQSSSNSEMKANAYLKRVLISIYSICRVQYVIKGKFVYIVHFIQCINAKLVKFKMVCTKKQN